MLFAAFCVMTALQADVTVKLTPLTKGASAKIGHYAPQRAAMTTDVPAALKKAPADLATPMYGVLPIGGGSGALFVLDEPDDGPAQLFVDSNANGDLTDDAAAEWTGEERKGKDGTTTTMYKGNALVDIGEAGKPMLVNLSLYRFDKDDPSRAELKSTLLYYRDYAYEGEVALAGKNFKAMLADEMARGDFRGKAPSEEDATKGANSGVLLFLDVNGNGKFDSRGESFDVMKPFNIGGTTFEIAGMARSGSMFKIVKSKLTVAEIATPPDHSVGKLITAFKANDTEGKPVNFPADFKGKIVLVDFWATWCGPCMIEMPNVVKAYEKYHASGFEILGISLDNEKSILKMPDVMSKSGMTWRQVADGKGWKAEIAQLYVISSIPATFLIDGTTGKVIGANLRGEALDAALATALGTKKPVQ